MYFFVKNGPATKFFSLFGLENVSWFASTKYALAFLIIVYVWQQIGFYMVIFIGGLPEVPAELYEACLLYTSLSITPCIQLNGWRICRAPNGW